MRQTYLAARENHEVEESAAQNVDCHVLSAGTLATRRNKDAGERSACPVNTVSLHSAESK